LLVYADPAKTNKWECKNDGFQFHLQELRATPKEKSGKFGNPYDTGIHSLYRFGGENENIKQYWIEVTFTDAPSTDVEAKLYHQLNGKSESLATRDAKPMANPGSFPLRGPLMKKTLTVERTNLCDFKFSYSTQGVDGFRWFAFNTNDMGYGNFSLPSGKMQNKGPAKYCELTAISGGGTKVLCSFPAW
jgi:hypothetical protein